MIEDEFDEPHKCCSQCGADKPLTEFNKKTSTWDGHRAQCRECQKLDGAIYRDTHKEEIKAWHAQNYIDNKDEINQRNKDYYHADPEREFARGKKYRDEHPEECAIRVAQWAKEHPDKRRESVSNRRALKLKATPKWLTEYDRSLIKDKFRLALLLEQETGIKHHVDHIIPLTSKIVCGLHVPDNLRVLTEKDNLRKGNKFKIK